MATREVQLELVLGRLVRDANGQPVGRLEEIRAEQQGEQWVVSEYLIGNSALFERLSARGIGLWLLRLLGARAHDRGYRVPWQQLDLDDWQRPRLRCARATLERIEDIRSD